MIRSVRIQPLSVLVGLVLGFLCFLTMSQSTVPTPLRVEYVPHPRDMVQIRGGTPYTVPSGRLFVLTALGSSGGGQARLFVDGVQELFFLYGCGCANGGGFGDNPTVSRVAQGFTVQAGSTVTLDVPSANPATARAWGYLVAQ